jgi:hypothetical protein
VTTVTGFAGVLTVREVQFALLDSSFERSLFGFVQLSVMVGIVAGDLGIHIADVIDHLLDFRFVCVRSVVRKFDRAVSNGFGERFFFHVVQLPIFVRVERGNLWEELCQMRGKNRGIMLRVMAGSISVVNLGDSKAAYGEAACDYGCECFEVFHSSVFYGLISPPWRLCAVNGRLVHTLVSSREIRALCEMDGRDFEMNTSECEMSGERQNAQTARLGGSISIFVQTRFQPS